MEERRALEMASHAQRVGAVVEKLDGFMDLLKRERLDVDDWAKSSTTYDQLLGYLQEEKRHALAFTRHGLEHAHQQLTAERKQMQSQIEAVEAKLSAAAADRSDVGAAVRTLAADGEARRVQQAALEVRGLKERLAETEAQLAGRDRGLKQHTYMHTCMHTYIHACIHAYMHTYMHTYIHTYMHTCIHAYIRTCIHTYMHTYIHAYMHTCIHTCMHTYIHTWQVRTTGSSNLT